MMTTVYTYIYSDGKVVAYTKGAVDQLLRRCIGIAEKGTVRPITEEDKERILAAASGMSRQALRVLAMAVKYDDDTATEEDLNFVGLVGMIDPARPEAKAAVESFREAGHHHYYDYRRPPGYCLGHRQGTRHRRERGSMHHR